MDKDIILHYSLGHCMNCKFSSKDLEDWSYADGTTFKDEYWPYKCRKKSPPWPKVIGSDWCGDFERK